MCAWHVAFIVVFVANCSIAPDAVHIYSSAQAFITQTQFARYFLVKHLPVALLCTRRIVK